MARPLQRLLQVASCSTTRRIVPSSTAQLLSPSGRPVKYLSSRQFSSTSQCQLLKAPHASFPDIVFETVQMVDPDTGSLLPAQPLRNIMKTINSEVEWPFLVSQDPPIVRIRNIEEQIKAERGKEAGKASGRRSNEKEVQIPWTIADGDLQRKIKIALTALEDGDRVNLVFAPKVGGGGKKKPLDQIRMNELVKAFEKGLDDVGKKWKPDETTSRMRSLFYAPLPSLKKVAEERLGDHINQQRKEREEKKEARRRKDEERRKKSEAAKGL